MVATGIAAAITWPTSGITGGGSVTGGSVTGGSVTGGSVTGGSVTGGVPGSTGVTGRIAATAAAAFTRPPVVIRPARAATGVVVERIAVRISAPVAAGLAAANRPTMPATCGVAIEVPL